jgi:hypothetical protein
MKKQKSKEILMFLLVAMVVFSVLIYLVYFASSQKDKNLGSVTTTIEAQKISADLIPKQSSVPSWKLTSTEKISINYSGFVEGSKARFSRKDGIAAITSRVEIYIFETEEAANKFYAGVVDEAKNGSYDEVELSYDIECYANSFYQDDISRYNLYCQDRNIYFAINMIGVKTEDSSKYSLEFFEAIKSKL